MTCLGGGPPAPTRRAPPPASRGRRGPRKRTSVLLGRPAHRDLDSRRRRRDVDVVGESRDDGEPQVWIAVQLGQVRRYRGGALTRRVVVGHTIAHHDLEAVRPVPQLHPDRLGRALLLMSLHRTRAGLTDRESYLVEQGLLDSATPGDGGGDEPCGAHVHRKGAERELDGGYLGRHPRPTSASCGSLARRRRSRRSRKPW